MTENRVPASQPNSVKLFLALGGAILVFLCLCSILLAVAGERGSSAKNEGKPAVAQKEPPNTFTPKPALTEKPSPTVKPTDTPRPTETPKPIPTDTPAPNPADVLTALGKKQFSKEFKDAKLANVAGIGNVATVDYGLGFQWDEESAILYACMDFIQFAPKVFEISDVDTLELRSFTDFKDVYGKTTSEVALKFTISRKTAEKISWKNVDRHKIGLALQLSGDGVYVHPALKAAWTKYQAG